MVLISRTLYVEALLAGQRAALIIGGLTFACIWVYRWLVGSAEREKVATIGLLVIFYLTLVVAAVAYFLSISGLAPLSS